MWDAARDPLFGYCHECRMLAELVADVFVLCFAVAAEPFGHEVEVEECGDVTEAAHVIEPLAIYNASVVVSGTHFCARVMMASTCSRFISTMGSLTSGIACHE